MSDLLSPLNEFLSSKTMTPRTREVLSGRIERGRGSSRPELRALSVRQFVCLSALVEVILDHDARGATNQNTDRSTAEKRWADVALEDVAIEIDQRIYSGEGNGWRYDELEPEHRMWILNLSKVDEESEKSFQRKTFSELLGRVLNLV